MSKALSLSEHHKTSSSTDEGCPVGFGRSLRGMVDMPSLARLTTCNLVSFQLSVRLEPAEWPGSKKSRPSSATRSARPRQTPDAWPSALKRPRNICDSMARRVFQLKTLSAAREVGDSSGDGKRGREAATTTASSPSWNTLMSAYRGPVAFLSWVHITRAHARPTLSAKWPELAMPGHRLPGGSPRRPASRP